LHLLRTGVVRDVFGGHGELIFSRWHSAGDDDFACVCTSLLIPAKEGGIGAFEPRDKRASAFRGVHFQGDRLAAMESSAIQANANRGRRAGDDEAFRFAIGMAELVAQDEPDVIGAVAHVAGREETRLPDILLRQVAQLLREAERK